MNKTNRMGCDKTPLQKFRSGTGNMAIKATLILLHATCSHVRAHTHTYIPIPDNMVGSLQGLLEFQLGNISLNPL